VYVNLTVMNWSYADKWQLVKIRSSIGCCRKPLRPGTSWSPSHRWEHLVEPGTPSWGPLRTSEVSAASASGVAHHVEDGLAAGTSKKVCDRSQIDTDDPISLFHRL